MKKLITLTILAFSLWSHAQNGITYQAVILNPNSEELPGADNSRLPLVNQSICLDFKIINTAFKVDYQETLTTRTDEFGMVNVVIGTGTRKAGLATQFKDINWDGTAKNLVVSFDSTGNCSQFIEISDQPFTYVPYALYAANGGATGAQGPVGPAGTNGLDGKTVLNGTTNPSANVGTNGDFYINTTTNNLFGPKTNGIWVSGVPLVGPQGIQGPQGPQGVAGTNGANGINGTNGLSAYQIWLNAGNTGTEAQFLTTLRGATGAQGSQGIQGLQGPIGVTGTTGPQGVAGTNGLSAYQIWLNAGNIGTEAQFLTALRGATGPQGIQGVAGPTGATGPQGTNGANGTNGNNGLSAYQIWLNAGNTGTEAQFLTALRGATGSAGPQGTAGTNGANGVNGVNGQDGLSAYQIWLNEGNIGTEAQFLTALRGETGAQGIAGTNGTNGLDGKTILNGSQDPITSIGNNGDFYINTTSNTLSGPKTSGTWGSGISLVGPQGATITSNTLSNKIGDRTFTMISNLSNDNLKYHQAIKYCLELSENGYDDWKLGTFSEAMLYLENYGFPQGDMYTWYMTTDWTTGGSGSWARAQMGGWYGSSGGGFSLQVIDDGNFTPSPVSKCRCFR